MGQLHSVLLLQEEAVVVMGEIHNILDNYFESLRDYGYVNNQQLLRVVLAVLIDDEYDSMVACNEKYRAVLNRLKVLLGNSSCIFELPDNCDTYCCIH